MRHCHLHLVHLVLIMRLLLVHHHLAICILVLLLPIVLLLLIVLISLVLVVLVHHRQLIGLSLNFTLGHGTLRVGGLQSVISKVRFGVHLVDWDVALYLLLFIL